MRIGSFKQFWEKLNRTKRTIREIARNKSTSNQLKIDLRQSKLWSYDDCIACSTQWMSECLCSTGSMFYLELQWCRNDVCSMSRGNDAPRHPHFCFVFKSSDNYIQCDLNLRVFFLQFWNTINTIGSLAGWMAGWWSKYFFHQNDKWYCADLFSFKFNDTNNHPNVMCMSKCETTDE